MAETEKPQKNLIQRIIARVDVVQQNHKALGFSFAVIKNTVTTRPATRVRS